MHDVRFPDDEAPAVEDDAEGLGAAWAKAEFAYVTKFECPLEDCQAPVGKLCDSPAVWVHLERYKLAESPTLF